MQHIAPAPSENCQTVIFKNCLIAKPSSVNILTGLRGILCSAFLSEIQIILDHTRVRFRKLNGLPAHGC